MDQDDDLMRWCEGDESAGLAWVSRRVDAAEVDQKLLSRCGDGEVKAIQRFCSRYLKDLDEARLARLLAEGRLAAVMRRLGSDLALLERWRGGNKSAGEALFMRYQEVLDRFVASKVRDSQEAMDLVQEVFTDLTKQHRQIQSFRPFMFKVAVNKVKMWYRRRYMKPVDTGLSGVSDLPETAGGGLEARAEEKIERKLLLLALQKLPLDQQMVLELYTWEEFTASEVAEIFEFQLHDIKHMLRRSKEHMREFVARHGHQQGLEASTEELARFLDELHDQALELVPAR